MRQEVTQQNSYLSDITELGKKRVIWSDFLHSLFGAIPQGITISSISGQVATSGNNSREKESVTKCSIKGEAPNRDALLAFQTTLRNLPGVADIVSPISNILGRLHPTYQIDINLKNQ